MAIDLSVVKNFSSKVSELKIEVAAGKFKELGCNTRDRNAIATIAKLRSQFNALMGSGYTTEAIAISQKLEEVEKQLEVLGEAMNDVPLTD